MCVRHFMKKFKYSYRCLTLKQQLWAYVRATYLVSFTNEMNEMKKAFIWSMGMVAFKIAKKWPRSQFWIFLRANFQLGTNIV